MQFGYDIELYKFSISDYLFDIRMAYSHKYITNKIIGYYSHEISGTLYRSDFKHYIRPANEILEDLEAKYDIAVKINDDAAKENIVSEIKKIHIDSVNSLFRLVWEHNIKLLNKDNAWIFILHMQSIFDFADSIYG